jgi:RNA polymerase subunit RPABC4/transcription elongation factor Spt4
MLRQLDDACIACLKAEMGVCLLLLLHLLAVDVFPWALLITLPIHVVYGAIRLVASDSRRCVECNEILAGSEPACPSCGNSTTSENEESGMRLTVSTAFSGSAIAPIRQRVQNRILWGRKHEI